MTLICEDCREIFDGHSYLWLNKDTVPEDRDRPAAWWAAPFFHLKKAGWWRGSLWVRHEPYCRVDDDHLVTPWFGLHLPLAPEYEGIWNASDVMSMEGPPLTPPVGAVEGSCPKCGTLMERHFVSKHMD